MATRQQNLARQPGLLASIFHLRYQSELFKHYQLAVILNFRHQILAERTLWCHTLVASDTEVSLIVFCIVFLPQTFNPGEAHTLYCVKF